MEMSIRSFYLSWPPKSPKGGLIGRNITIIILTLYKFPFGGFRGQTRKREKESIYWRSPNIYSIKSVKNQAVLYSFTDPVHDIFLIPVKQICGSGGTGRRARFRA
jgi:hypothetical protein